MGQMLAPTMAICEVVLATVRLLSKGSREPVSLSSKKLDEFLSISVGKSLAPVPAAENELPLDRRRDQMRRRGSVGGILIESMGKARKVDESSIFGDAFGEGKKEEE